MCQELYDIIDSPDVRRVIFDNLMKEEFRFVKSYNHRDTITRLILKKPIYDLLFSLVYDNPTYKSARDWDNLLDRIDKKSLKIAEDFWDMYIDLAE